MAKIAIISDTHSNLATTKKIIDWLNKEEIKLLLHCGDINTQDAVDEIKNTFLGEAKFVRGNADVSIEGLEEIGEATAGDKKIAFCHFIETAETLAKTGKYSLVFYGHVHRPWSEMIGNCRMANPGEAAGQYQKPTFAVYDSDSDKLELKILERLE